MPNDDLTIRLVNATTRDRRLILYQTNAVQASNDTNLLYVWDSRLLGAQGGQAGLSLPIAFAVAGMIGGPPDFTLSASQPGVYGQCWSLQQADAGKPLSLSPCTMPPTDGSSLAVENGVSFARRSGVILKASRLLFGAEIVPNGRAVYQVLPSFWVAVSDLKRGDLIPQLPPAASTCQVPYSVPSAVTEYVVTLTEKPGTGELVFTVQEVVTPKRR